MSTLSRRLGTTTHLSPLLHKARRLGLATPRALQTLAVQRGCDHYRRGDESADALPSRAQFTDEDLAIALLHLEWEWDPQMIRLGAAMLGSQHNDPRRLARLAIMERCEPVVRHVAEAGRQFEPDNDFWTQLLAALPASAPVKSGVLPHPTRFGAMTGLTQRGRETVTEWIRPAPMPTHG